MKITPPLGKVESDLFPKSEKEQEQILKDLKKPYYEDDKVIIQ